MTEIVQGLVVRPGDTLIIIAGHPMSLDEMERISAQIKECIPGLANVAMLDNVWPWIAAYRPEGSE